LTRGVRWSSRGIRGGIKISDTTYVWYGFPLLCRCHCGISMTSCVLFDGMSLLRRRIVMANLACGIPELNVVFRWFLWHRINIKPHLCDFWGCRNTLVMVFGLETPSTATSETTLVCFYYCISNINAWILHTITGNSMKFYRSCTWIACGMMGCQSGAVVRTMFEINISGCHLWGRGFNSQSDPFLMW
jgi:hypothetical protein